MQDFKSGKRPATVMHQIAKGYTRPADRGAGGVFRRAESPVRGQDANSRGAIFSGTATAGAVSAAASPFLSSCATAPEVRKPIGRVIVIGGGFGGATAAKYLRMWSMGAIEVFMIERNTEFVSCPMSNLVLGGSKKIGDITRGYAKLRDYGVQVIRDEVTGINVEKKRVGLKRIEDLPVRPADRVPGRGFDA